MLTDPKNTKKKNNLYKNGKIPHQTLNDGCQIIQGKQSKQYCIKHVLPMSGLHFVYKNYFRVTS